MFSRNFLNTSEKASQALSSTRTTEVTKVVCLLAAFLSETYLTYTSFHLLIAWSRRRSTYILNRIPIMVRSPKKLFLSTQALCPKVEINLCSIYHCLKNNVFVSYCYYATQRPVVSCPMLIFCPTVPAAKKTKLFCMSTLLP